MPSSLRVNIIFAVEAGSLHSQEPKNRDRGGESMSGSGFSIKVQAFMYCRGSAPRVYLPMWLLVHQSRADVPHTAGHLHLTWCALDPKS